MSGKPLHYCTALLLGFLTALSAAACHAAQLNIGVLAFQGTEQALQRWQATADYLSRSLPEHRFRIVALSLDGIETRTAERSLDFVLTNPGHYVVLEARFGVSRIATLVGGGEGPERDRFASVLFSRADGPVKTLQDIPGQRFAAVAEQAFGGFQLAQWTLLQDDIDLLAEPDKLLWTGFPQRDIVRAVLSGRAEAGTVRTGVLEAMAADGELELAQLRILGRRQTPGFPYAHSTILVPQWPFAKLPQTPKPLARQVAIALMNLPADDPANRSASIGGWTIPSDYSTVHTVLHDLEVGPYRRPPLNWRRLLQDYGRPLALSLLALLAVLAFSVHTLTMNRRLAQVRLRLEAEVAQRREAQAALARHSDQLEQRVAERSRQLQQAGEERDRRQAELSHVARVAVAGELVGGLAHELNQPLTAALNYANGSLRHLARQPPDVDTVSDGLRRNIASIERASEVLATLRSFVRSGDLPRQRVLLDEQIELVLDLMAADLRHAGIRVERPASTAAFAVLANPVHLQQILVNLIRNALEAIDQAGSDAPTIRITLSRAQQRLRLCVIDNGSGLPAGDAREQLLDSFNTTKADGLGMGLSISRSLIETHGGQLILADAPQGQGAKICLELPEMP